jgi:hypothetical protein
VAVSFRGRAIPSQRIPSPRVPQPTCATNTVASGIYLTRSPKLPSSPHRLFSRGGPHGKTALATAAAPTRNRRGPTPAFDFTPLLRCALQGSGIPGGLRHAASSGSGPRLRIKSPRRTFGELNQKALQIVRFFFRASLVSSSAVDSSSARPSRPQERPAPEEAMT